MPTAVSDNIQVKFGESKAEVVSCSATELKVKIPAPADGTFGETNMVVTLSGLEIYTHKFTIKETPVITSITSVSYTHLRAHETRHDLVCRLLLEKKKFA